MVFNIIQIGVQTAVTGYDKECILNKISLRDHLALCVCMCVHAHAYNF